MNKGDTMEKINQIGNKIKELFIKLGKWAKTSKLNMSVTIATSVIIVLGIVITIIISSRGGVDNKITVTTVHEETADSDIETTMPTPGQDELFTTNVNEAENGKFVNNPTLLEPKLTAKMTWTSEGVSYTQYSLTIKNVSDTKIDGWVLILRNDNSFDISDNWNAQYSVNGSNLVIMPFPDNEVISVGEEINIGFVISSYKYIYFNSATVFVGDACESFNINVHRNEQTTTTGETTKDDSSSETTTNKETTTTFEEETTTVDDETTTIDDKSTSIDEETPIQETTVFDSSDSTAPDTP